MPQHHAIKTHKRQKASTTQTPAAETGQMQQPQLTPYQQTILTMQHSVGNAAVMRMLVQREPEEGAPSEQAAVEQQTEQQAPDPGLASQVQGGETMTGMRIPITFDLLAMLDPRYSGGDPSMPWFSGNAGFKEMQGATLYGASGQPAKEDVKQGQMGDCYLLSAIIAIVNANPSLISSLIKDNGDGTYDVTIYENGAFSSNKAGKRAKKIVKVKPTFPTNDKGGALYAQPKNNTFWAMLIEKAYAQHEGGYDEISGTVFGGEKGLKALTNAKVESHGVNDFTADQLLDTLEFNLNNGQAITANINKSVNPWNWSEIEKLGLVTGHVYAVIGVDKANKTVNLQNPWGYKHQPNLAIRLFQKYFASIDIAILKSPTP